MHERQNECMGRALARLSRDLYSVDTHFVLELVQVSRWQWHYFCCLRGGNCCCSLGDGALLDGAVVDFGTCHEAS